MRDKPLIVSLLIGLIVVLVIAGVSLLAKINSLSKTYKQELASGLRLGKENEEMKVENVSLKEEGNALQGKVKELNSQIENLNAEIKKLERLNSKLEESLKEELMEKKLKEQEQKGQ